MNTTHHKDAVEEENPSKAVTPEWLEAEAKTLENSGWNVTGAAKVIRAAAQALRAAQTIRERAESERDEMDIRAGEYCWLWEEAKAKNERLEERLGAEKQRQAQEIERKDQQLADLREALRFYAKRTHWMEVSEDASSRTVIVAIGPSGNPNGWGEAEDALSTTDTAQQVRED